jgi:addiction module RelE/StbE family toxin
MNLVWLPTAIAQRERVIEFIAEDNIEAALRLDDQIDAKCDRLIDYPFSGRHGRMPETRELVVHPNYFAVYRIVDDVVEIVAFLHAAQLWP